MSIVIPSYTEKATWAETHLKKLERLTQDFADAHPYTARHTVQQGHDQWHLVFTQTPDRKIPLVAGDFLYNVRACLDHLACALVPSADRRSVSFPIIRHAVWDIPFQEGEGEQVTQARERWNTCTRNMRDEAVTIIKRAQPTDLAFRGVDALLPDFHVMDVLSRLRNKDTHGGLVVLASALGDPDVTYVTSDGNLHSSVGSVGPGQALENGARIYLPAALHSVVNVQVQGTPRIAIRFGASHQGIQGTVEIPVSFQTMLATVRRLIVDLSPYLHVTPKGTI